MDINTKFAYETEIGKLTFQYESNFWITDISGVSSVAVDISESRGSGQIGSNIAAKSVRPRSIIIDGVIYEPLKTNRDRLIKYIPPLLPATLTKIDGNESWYLDVTPEQTPEIAPGAGEQEFQMTLKAARPYWRSTKSYTQQVAGLTALWKTPFYTGGTHWISKFNDNYYTVIDNPGNVPLEFTVIFTARGTVKKPQLIHTGTQKKILTNKTFSMGEQLVVTTEYVNRGAVFVGSSGIVENGFRFVRPISNWDMNLPSGPNVLRIDAEEGRDLLSARIRISSEGEKSGV